MAKKPIKDYPQISLDPAKLTGQIDFNDIFGRNADVHIEIGSGKGTFLLAQAKAFPSINFLGIEWARKYYRHAVDRIGRWQLDNVRIIRTDAADFLTENTPDTSVSCFHIYFPDPWPKKRHHKRRFLCRENMAGILRCLKTDGRINIATDHADYYQQIKEVIDAKLKTGELKIVKFTPAAGVLREEVAGTNYERKYIKDGRPIYTVAAQKQ